MKSALVIFNGLKFPYYLMEYSLAQAKEQDIVLHLIFLRAQKEDSEDYGFPSDINATEDKMLKEEGEMYDQDIISRHMKLADDMAAYENVYCKKELIINGTLAEISKVMENFDMVYTDASFDNVSSSLLGNDKFSLRELIEVAPAKIKLISEDGVVV